MTVGPDSWQVREMFAAVARRYDLNNRLHSLWRDQAWRRAAARAADLAPGQSALDVACGTGDLAAAGFEAPTQRRLTAGIAWLTVARKS